MKEIQTNQNGQIVTIDFEAWLNEGSSGISAPETLQNPLS